MIRVRPKISAVILAKNEEKNIAQCIQSLDWCDEVVVIDDNSTDNTVSASKKLGANVITRELNNSFSYQRNFALDHVRSDWVLFVDADEGVSAGLKTEIQEKLLGEKSATINGYLIQRRDRVWDKELLYGDVKDVWLLRLGKKDAGKWFGHVHETWKMSGRVEKLTNAFIHSPHNSVGEFLKKINYYSTIRADELYTQKTTVSWFEIVFYPIGKFLVNYIWKCGFLDGNRGMIHAILMSFYSFMVRAKLWLLYQKKTHVG